MKRVVAIGALLFALTGCGTVENFTDGCAGRTKPYGGTQIAVDRFGKARDAELALKGSLWLADMPLCVIGDTLTLPLALAIQITGDINAYYFPPEKAPESREK